MRVLDAVAFEIFWTLFDIADVRQLIAAAFAAIWRERVMLLDDRLTRLASFFWLSVFAHK